MKFTLEKDVDEHFWRDSLTENLLPEALNPSTSAHHVLTFSSDCLFRSVAEFCQKLKLCVGEFFS